MANIAGVDNAISFKDLINQYPAPASTLPPEQIAAYNKYINTPVSAPSNPTDFSDVKGISGIVSKIGDLVSSSTGQHILAGLTKNPYLAESYLSGANVSREQELNQAALARQAQIAKMNSIGDLIKEQGKERADIAGKQADVNAQIEANAPMRAAQVAGITSEIANREAENKLKTQTVQAEIEKKKYEETIKPQLDNLKDMFTKGQLSAGDYQKATDAISKGLKVNIKGGGRGVPVFGGNKASIEILPSGTTTQSKVQWSIIK